MTKIFDVSADELLGIENYFKNEKKDK